MESKRALRRRTIKPAFDRWIPREKSTWPFQVFQNYNQELERNLAAYIPASKFVYSKLTTGGALWEDKPEKHLALKIGQKTFTDLKAWSVGFNAFDNWVNLNILMTISSTFETYLATIVSVALQSDPGLLFGSSRSLDGIFVLKNGSISKIDYEWFIKSCTMGDWMSRLGAYERLFGIAPTILKNNISTLDKIRIMRNNVGHAFGRDIDESRKHGIKAILPIESLGREKVLKYQNLLWKIAKSIDKQILIAHIGEFQALNFYHNLHLTLNKDDHPSVRAQHFKKKLGQSGVQAPSKLFTRQLVDYYEKL